MKKIVDFYITKHGTEHAQYFQGHGIALASRWDDCATGCGDSEVSALEDALEMLAQDDWDVDALEGSPEFRKAFVECSASIPEVISEQGEDGELYVYVSVDVMGEEQAT